MALDFTGSVACVTGAAQGFGRAIADRIADAGGSVVYADRNLSNLEGVRSNTKARVVQCDVSDPDNVSSMYDMAVRDFGRLDIVVCNAGVLWSSRIEDITVEEWRKTMDVNLDGVFWSIQRAIPHFKKQQYGRAVCISSSAGRSVSTVGGAHYTASKAGVLGVTRAAAHELAKYNVTVNAVCPGLFETEMVTTNIDKWGKTRQEYEASFPVARLGKPVEVADLVCFLASKNASYITGASIDINGGDLMM